VLTFDKIGICVPTQSCIGKKRARKVWTYEKKGLPLQRYPENNLFTLEN